MCFPNVLLSILPAWDCVIRTNWRTEITTRRHYIHGNIQTFVIQVQQGYYGRSEDGLTLVQHTTRQNAYMVHLGTH